MSDSIIQIQNVNKWFGDFQVLKEINLEVKPKEKIVVCGPSGSGKSTLIRCINRLEEHQKGNITVDGTEITIKEYQAALNKQVEFFNQMMGGKGMTQKQLQGGHTIVQRRYGSDVCKECFCTKRSNNAMANALNTNHIMSRYSTHSINNMATKVER